MPARVAERALSRPATLLTERTATPSRAALAEDASAGTAHRVATTHRRRAPASRGPQEEGTAAQALGVARAAPAGARAPAAAASAPRRRAPRGPRRRRRRRRRCRRPGRRPVGERGERCGDRATRPPRRAGRRATTQLRAQGGALGELRAAAHHDEARDAAVAMRVERAMKVHAAAASARTVAVSRKVRTDARLAAHEERAKGSSSSTKGCSDVEALQRRQFVLVGAAAHRHVRRCAPLRTRPRRGAGAGAGGGGGGGGDRGGGGGGGGDVGGRRRRAVGGADARPDRRRRAAAARRAAARSAAGAAASSTAPPPPPAAMPAAARRDGSRAASPLETTDAAAANGGRRAPGGGGAAGGGGGRGRGGEETRARPPGGTPSRRRRRRPEARRGARPCEDTSPTVRPLRGIARGAAVTALSQLGAPGLAITTAAPTASPSPTAARAARRRQPRRGGRGGARLPPCGRRRRPRRHQHGARDARACDAGAGGGPRGGRPPRRRCARTPSHTAAGTPLPPSKPSRLRPAHAEEDPHYARLRAAYARVNSVPCSPALLPLSSSQPPAP